MPEITDEHRILLLLHMASHGFEGSSQELAKRISEITGLDEDTVQQILKELRRRGLIASVVDFNNVHATR